MKITGYGNASLKIESEDTVLFFDPYRGQCTQDEMLRRDAEFAAAESVFITHGHFDHLGSVNAIYRDRDAAVYCTAAPAETLKKQGFPEDKIRIIQPGTRVEKGSLTVTAIHTEHCRFDAGEIIDVLFRHRMLRRLGTMLRLLRLDAAYPAKKECLMYDVADGNMRIQILGSAGLDEKNRYSTGAELLILPYQGRSDMCRYCMDIVERLKPKQVLLDHYDDAFPPLTCREDTEPFIRAMREKHPDVPCRELGKFETVEL